MSRTGRAAILYAQMFGWPVLPLLARRKEPAGDLVKNGVTEATTDIETITTWYHVYPEANVGLAATKFIVLDEDPRNGGDDTRAALEAKHGRLPHTVRQLTGSGGAHYLFLPIPGVQLRGSLGDGLDLKSTGGYIAAAPSIHPNGIEYCWDAGAHPSETALATAPDWLVNLAVKPKTIIGMQIGAAAESFLARCFAAAGWLGEVIDDVRVQAQCPWVSSHTADSRGRRTGNGNDSSTILFAATTAKPIGGFHCSHGHCSARKLADVLRALPAVAVRDVARAMPRQFQLALNIMRRCDHAA